MDAGRAAVTGATGFIGGHLTRALLERGWEVRAVARATSRAEDLEAAGARVHRCGLFDPAGLRAAFAGADVVFHLAAVVTDWAPRAEYRRANVAGARAVAEAAADAGAGRLVHVSTTDVYGYPDRSDLDETAPLAPNGWGYVDTKIAAEQEVRRVAADRALELAVARPATVFGPGDRYFVLEVAEYLRAGFVPLVNGGRARPGFGYVENVAAALILAGTRPEAAGGTYNLHDATGASWRDYVIALGRHLGFRARLVSIPGVLARPVGAAMEGIWGALRLRARPPFTRHAVAVLGTEQEFSTERLRSDLGFVPAVSMDEGLARAAAWCRPLIKKG